jgi:hypothetical protein
LPHSSRHALAYIKRRFSSGLLQRSHH